MPKYVPTTTLQEAEWNATLIKDNVVEEVTRVGTILPVEEEEWLQHL